MPHRRASDPSNRALWMTSVSNQNFDLERTVRQLQEKYQELISSGNFKGISRRDRGVCISDSPWLPRQFSQLFKAENYIRYRLIFISDFVDGLEPQI